MRGRPSPRWVVGGESRVQRGRLEVNKREGTPPLEVTTESDEDVKTSD